MKKRTIRTIENKYDEDGNLIKSIETIVEDIVYSDTIPPNFPSVSDDIPYRNDIRNKPKDVNEVYTNRGSDPLSVTYGKSGSFKAPPLPPEGPKVRRGI